MTHIKKLTCIFALFGMSSTFGEITYVDAQEGPSGNTFATGGSLSNTDWIDSTTNSPSSNDSLWAKRFGGNPGWSQHNGGDVLQAIVTSTDTDTLGEITTEISGLADGDYDVWVFFWEQLVSGTQNWLIDSGLTSGSLVSYSSPLGPVEGTDSSTPVNAATLSFTNSPSVVGAGGNQNMFGVYLGQVTVTNGSSIEVFIDKLIGNGSNNRTIYDGVGYEFVGASTSGPEITGFTQVSEGIWEVELSGQSNTGYILRSSSTLDFDTGTVIEGLSQENPQDAGEIGGINNNLITTDASGIAKVRITLGKTSDFIRVELAP